jgi:hypothetical protein
MDMDELRKAMIERLKRDISSLKQGIEWMESGVLKTGESKGGWIIDQTPETLASYRRSVADLERQLASIEGQGP